MRVSRIIPAILLLLVSILVGCAGGGRTPVTPKPPAGYPPPATAVAELSPPDLQLEPVVPSATTETAPPSAPNPYLTRFTIPPERIEEFTRWSSEGGVWTELPPKLIPDEIFSVEDLRERMQGDDLLLLGYLQDRHHQRWHAIMAPITWIAEDRIEVGFEGNVLAFDVNAARARWKRRRHHEGLPATLADKVADELIRREEERLNPAASTANTQKEEGGP